MDNRKVYHGCFRLDEFEKYLAKCKSPKIYTDAETLIHIAQKSQGEDIQKSTNDIMLLMLVKINYLQMKDADKAIIDTIEKMIDTIEKVNLPNKTYNLYGLKVPIEIIDKVSNNKIIYFYDQESDETTGMFLY